MALNLHHCSIDGTNDKHFAPVHTPQMVHTPRVFTIPASVPFLSTLIKALLDGRLVPGFAPALDSDPLALTPPAPPAPPVDDGSICCDRW